MNLARISLAGLAAAALLAIAGVGTELASSAEPDSAQGITVTGTGDVRATPDRADFSFGVHSEGPTAARALSANSAEVRRLIAALKEAGVEPAQLTTEHVGVSPRYEPDKVEGSNGYSADAMLSVSSQGLDAASRLIDIGMSAGADSVQGPGLSVVDQDAQNRRALKLAFTDARMRAEALAEAAGVSLGKVTAIIEGGQPVGGPIPYALADRSAMEAKTPIEPGKQIVAATVTVTFAIT